MKPYRLGEQPTDREYVKLNSNESPFAASPKVLQVIEESARQPLGYYADQDGTILRDALAGNYGIDREQVFVGNGADEILSFCFLAYAVGNKGLCYPDITYGFYRTFANTYGVHSEVIPLDEDFQIDTRPYEESDKTVVIPNPNAPTGRRISMEKIEHLLDSKKGRIVVIDEAYVDFETKSCISILDKHPNLIVVHTMSKSRNIAGLHVGYAIASKEIIEDLNALKNCFNPNNVNLVTLNAAVAAVEDEAYNRKVTDEKVRVRKDTQKKLEAYDFYVVESFTNFLFVSHPDIEAKDLEKELREYGILTRYYDEPRISNFLRITIGNEEEMKKVTDAVKQILTSKIEVA